MRARPETSISIQDLILYSIASEESLYFFEKKILGFELYRKLHLPWTRLIQDPQIKRVLILAPRLHLKSTVITVGATIWTLYKNINARIAIFSARARVAKGFIRQIRGLLASHPLLKEIWRAKYGTYPLLSAEESTTEYITLKRPIPHKEPSVVVLSPGQEPVSWHFDKIVCDDVVWSEDRYSEATREFKKKWFQEIPSLLEEGGEIDVIGTRWHPDDLYHDLLEKPEYSDYVKVVQRVWDENGEPLYPIKFTKERIESLKKEQGLFFNSQYLNDPSMEGEALFSDIEIIDKSAYPKIENWKHVAFLDPATTKVTTKNPSPDFSALVVVAKPQGHPEPIVIRKMIAKRLKYSEVPRWVVREILQFKSLAKVGVEANNFQIYVVQEVRKLLREGAFRIKVIPVTHSRSKAERIESLEPLFSNGVLKLEKDSWNEEAYQQLTQYPFVAHDDIPDALEGAVSLILKHKVASGQKIRKGGLRV